MTKFNQICSKVYYQIVTGEVLVITTECESTELETTKEQDVNIYNELKDKQISDIDFIKLEYGTLASTLNNSKSYKVNVTAKKLEVIYYAQEELNAIQQQAQRNDDLNARVSDISTYLGNNVTTIADVEDLILQSEQNKIINGGM
ncbi:hypothetical protein [Clostridium beijerinckii]|uniref:hypothetical protein n=1 Tax=Clostridium beijerinckii TaxID=1520 RepID=UPI00047CD25A|nr:hypothetical protein [Clostridium beijerinckii]